jgi:hypothetical protein
MDSNLVWLALIVLISYSTQAMSGFGSTVLALTLGVHLSPMDVLLPVLVSLDRVVNLYIDEYRFKIFIFAVLLFAGLSIIIA